MINFTHAFDTAWERMSVILFRPFDLGKWFAIGFSAFLAGLISGGNGVHSSYRQNFSPSGNTSFTAAFQQFQANVSHLFSGLQIGLIVFLAAGIFVFTVAILVLLAWLGARGQFLILDNVVRNRAAIVAPWKFYARPANQVFLLRLIFLAVNFGVLLVFLAPWMLLAYPLLQSHEWPRGGLLFGLALLGLAYLGVSIALACVMFIFREWGIPLMFRNGINAWAAFLESMDLIRRYPGPTTLFILLRIALAIGLLVISVLTYCFSCCCLAVVPYIGTVVLLPALIYIRCFNLDCLAQFGPTYDAWTVDVPPVDTPPPDPLSPPPPLG